MVQNKEVGVSLQEKIDAYQALLSNAVIFNAKGLRIFERYKLLDTDAVVDSDADMDVDDGAETTRLFYSANTNAAHIWIDADQDPNDLVAMNAEQVLIIITNFTDGRVFSLARMLQNKSRVMVAGMFSADQVAYFLRLGVEEFAPSDPNEAAALPKAIADLQGSHNGLTADALPVFAKS